jgi:hypothetical protein
VWPCAFKRWSVLNIFSLGFFVRIGSYNGPFFSLWNQMQIRVAEAMVSYHSSQSTLLALCRLANCGTKHCLVHFNFCSCIAASFNFFLLPCWSETRLYLSLFIFYFIKSRHIGEGVRDTRKRKKRRSAESKRL